jgi:AraC-like DNA-binding protein
MAMEAGRICTSIPLCARLLKFLLDDSDPPDLTITQVAMSWGFSHLGRFSEKYRVHFGESPSAMLRRRSLQERS